MNFERTVSRPSIKERLNKARCSLVELTTFDELAEGAALDQEVFSENRPAVGGEDVAQPLVTVEDYLHAAHFGRIYGLRAAGHDKYKDGTLVGVAGIMLEPDPESEEPLWRYMQPKDAYLWLNAVKKGMRGTGCGGILLDVRLQAARDDGKERVFTVVHPTNIDSMGNLRSRDLLGVGWQENYYNLHGWDGLRLIMMNGDIHDPDWATNFTYPEYPNPLNRFSSSSKTFNVPERTVTDLTEQPEPPFESFGAVLEALGMGSCLIKAKRDADNPEIIHYTLKPCRFIRSLHGTLAERLYPFSGLIEGYQASISAVPTPQMHALIAEIISPQLRGMNRFESTPTRYLYERMFTDWLVHYHRNLQNPDATTVLPAEPRGRFYHSTFLQDVKNKYLRDEYYYLRRFAGALAQSHPVAAQVNALRLPERLGDKLTLSELAKQNAQLYSIFGRQDIRELVNEIRKGLQGEDAYNLLLRLGSLTVLRNQTGRSFE